LNLPNEDTGLKLDNISFSFNPDTPVFKNLSVEFRAESPVMILGLSGCGKTTLLNLIAGLRMPVTGEITPRPASVSMVFQEPRLLPWKTVCENVSLPLLHAMGKESAAEKAMKYLRLVALEDKANSYPSELSGGQKQRVNLARAFVCPGEIMLMDEPFQSLDIPLRIELMELTRTLLAISAENSSAEKKSSDGAPFLVLIVTHEPREAVYMGKRIIVLGERPKGIIFDEKIDLKTEDRIFGSVIQGEWERKILEICRIG